MQAGVIVPELDRLGARSLHCAACVAIIEGTREGDDSDPGRHGRPVERRMLAGYPLSDRPGAGASRRRESAADRLLLACVPELRSGTLPERSVGAPLDALLQRDDGALARPAAHRHVIDAGAHDREAAPGLR